MSLKCRSTREIFGPLCGAEASWRTPLGPQCERHALAAIEAIREGVCLAAMLADKNGVPREKLIEQYPIADDPDELWSFGLPFNFGIIAVASSTPRVYTPPQLPPPPAEQGVVAITARIQT